MWFFWHFSYGVYPTFVALFWSSKSNWLSIKLNRDQLYCDIKIHFPFFRFQSDGSNIMELIEPTTLVSWSFVLIYMACDFGEAITTQYTAIDYSICECDWYSFPLEIQKMLPMVMMSTQKAMIVQVFGKVACTRETFNRVNYF